ncbi:hypothetical protein [Streptomyces sp. NPDC058757]|uniref:hypothetical protein n=1 Tax=Streptomyces sp. NPDC058757 TaxID=3346626 RepID=UPI00368248A7
MTRTAHHLSGPSPWDGPRGGPWRALVLYDLRYSSRVLTDAARAGRRPRPQRIRRRVAVRSFPRFRHDPFVAREAARLERRARQDLRARLTAARRLADRPGPDTGTGGLGLAAAGAVDIPPARHRRNSLWLA